MCAEVGQLGHPERLVTATGSDAKAAVLSPDSRWIAYVSNEQGANEVFVRPFPNVNGGKWQVSSGGGSAPLWAHNGRELFYAAGGKMHVVRFNAGATFSAEPPRVLFAIPDRVRAGALANGTFAITPDDRRFLMVRDNSWGRWRAHRQLVEARRSFNGAGIPLDEGVRWSAGARSPHDRAVRRYARAGTPHDVRLRWYGDTEGRLNEAVRWYGDTEGPLNGAVRWSADAGSPLDKAVRWSAGADSPHDEAVRWSTGAGSPRDQDVRRSADAVSPLDEPVRWYADAGTPHDEVSRGQPEAGRSLNSTARRLARPHRRQVARPRPSVSPVASSISVSRHATGPRSSPSLGWWWSQHPRPPQRKLARRALAG